ncbi:MAG: hypothetical protein J2P26_05905 [Nocardiopsaceae bacterium]|nr:hypothetical protein [Nocardiopsaceae bacterium]
MATCGSGSSGDVTRPRASGLPGGAAASGKDRPNSHIPNAAAAPAASSGGDRRVLAVLRYLGAAGA